MIDTFKIFEELKQVLDPPIAEKIAEVLSGIYQELSNSITKTEFNELKKIVSELADAQKRTEEKLEELAEAQRKTEKRVDKLEEAVKELASAQKRTEEEIRKLARDQRSIRAELGGLSRTVSYGFENEVFRLLPKFLKEKFGIRIKKRLIRADIGGKEVNIFGKGVKNGREVYVVGEVKLRITERKDQERALKDIEEKVKAVTSEYGKVEVVKLLITHFARKSFLERAEREGIAVIQSFEL